MSRDEFEQGVAQVRRRLVRVAAGVVGHGAAEDAVQDALFRVVANNHWVKLTSDELPAYLVTAVLNHAKDFTKTEARHAEYLSSFVDTLIEKAVTEDDLNLAVDLQRALATLDDETRYAVESVVMHGLTYRAVAFERGLSKSDVQRRVAAGLAVLRSLLGTNPRAVAFQAMQGGAR